MNVQVPTGLSPYPYPGLRAFQKSEADIFFGRDQQIDQLLAKLDQHRFLAVLGPSGCGKSSLIRAGLIPALETGFMASAGYRWRTTAMRPGDSPLANLATALVEDRICHAEHDAIQDELAFLRATLNRGPLGLIEALKERRFPDDENLLLLIDQFEELFRFERHGGRSESRAFVDLLLASADYQGLPVYVVITMRSEFLGQCPLFRGLPEAMNDSQFLTPRLTRDQIRDTVLGPASMFNTEIEPAVVTQILNSMGTDPDQLPLMQHLLMRMWRRAALDASEHEQPAAADSEDSRLTWEDVQQWDGFEWPRIVLTSVEYEKAGGLGRALHNHAEKTFQTGLANDHQRRLAEIVFRHLTEINQDGHTIRRPATVAEICNAAKIDGQDPGQFAELARVIDAFRVEGRSFLMPPSNEVLTLDTRLDISHETLIRQWERLRTWTVKEDNFRKNAREVHTKAQRWKAAGRQSDFLLTGVDLARALEWQEQLDTDVTSTQTDPEVLTFLAESEKQRDRGERERQQAKYASILKVLAATVAVLAAIAVGMAILVWQERQQARATVARQTLEKAARLMTDGDLTGSMLWIQDALEQDRALGLSDRERLHRIRLGAGMSQLARLENFWGLPEVDTAALGTDSSFRPAPSAPGTRGDLKATYLVPSPDGRFAMIVAGTMPSEDVPDGSGSVWIWDLRDPPASPNGPEPWAKLPHTYPVRHASWSPDSRFVMTASAAARNKSGEILLWNIEKLRRAGKSGSYSPVRLDAGGRGVWTAFSDPSESDELFALAVVELDRKLYRVCAWRFDRSHLEGMAEKGNFARCAREVDGIVKWAGFRPETRRDTTEGNQSATRGSFLIAGSRGENTGFIEGYRLPTEIATSGAASDPDFVCLQPIRIWPQPAAVNWVAFRPDGQRFAVACQNQVRIFDWSVSGSTPIWEKRHNDEVQHIAFSPDGRLVVSASRDNSAQIWNSEDGAWNGALRHDRWVHWAQFSPDGRHILTAGRDQVVKIWDLATRTLVVPALNHAGAVQQAYFTADGTRVLTRSWNLIRLWSMETGNSPGSTVQGELSGGANDRSAWKLKHSENGRCVGLLSRNAEGQWGVLLRDLQDGRTSSVKMPHAMDDLWVDDGGRYVLVSGSAQAKTPAGAWIYDCRAGGDPKPAELLFPKGAPQRGMKLARFLRLGDACVLVTVDNYSKTANGAENDQDLRITKDTHCLVRTWNVESGELLSQQAYPTVGVAAYLAVSPDFERAARVALLTSYEDQPNYAGKVIVWEFRRDSDRGELPDLDHGQKIVLDHADGSTVHAAFDRDGKRLLTTANANKDRALLWDLTRPANGPLVELRHTSDITHVGFSNEKEHQAFLITCSFDNTAKVWKNPRSLDDATQRRSQGECVSVLRHDKRVSHASFAPDEDCPLVATSSQDGSTRLWDARTGELVAQFRAPGEIQCAVFLEDTAEPPNRLVRMLSRMDAPRAMRICDWRISPLPTEYGDCIPLVAARQRVGDVGLEPTELFDRWREEAESGDQMPDDTTRVARRLGARHMLDQFQLYRERFPSNGEPSLARHWRDADEAELLGQWFAVQWHLSRILEETQNDGSALRRRSRAYAETQQWEQVVADLQRIETQGSATLSDWQLAGDANRKLKRWNVALAAYQRALKSNPDSAHLLSGAVEAAAELAEWDAVEDYLQRLVKQHPDSHEILTQLAAVSLHRGDLPTYAENCRRLVEKFAKATDPQIANVVSWTCSLSEQPVAPEAALRFAEMARKSDPNSDRYANTLAAAFYRLGRYTEAVELLEQARRMRTTSVFTAAEETLRPPMTLESTAISRQVPFSVPSEADSVQLYQSSRGSVWDWLYLAMAQFHLGRLDDAKRSLDAAECWFGECGLAAETATGGRAGGRESGPYDLSLIPWPRRLELQILRGQARSLIMQ